MSKPISEWVDEIREYVVDKGFYTPSSIRDEKTPHASTKSDLGIAELMLAAVDLSHAAEAIRKDNGEEAAEAILATKDGLNRHCISIGPEERSLTEGDMMYVKLMLVITELGEAAEAVEIGDEENFKEEIADAVIRLMDICGAIGMDLEEEIAKKMEVNKKRPTLHGKKR